MFFVASLPIRPEEAMLTYNGIPFCSRPVGSPDCRWLLLICSGGPRIIILDGLWTYSLIFKLDREGDTSIGTIGISSVGTAWIYNCTQDFFYSQRV